MGSTFSKNVGNWKVVHNIRRNVECQKIRISHPHEIKDFAGSGNIFFKFDFFTS